MTGESGDWGKWGLGEVVTGEVGTVISCKKGCQMSALSMHVIYTSFQFSSYPKSLWQEHMRMGGWSKSV